MAWRYRFFSRHWFSIVKNTPSEDVTNILVIIEFGNEIQSEIDLYVTNNKLNEASLDKSLILSQKYYKISEPNDLLFKDVKHFDAQNMVIAIL